MILVKGQRGDNTINNYSVLKLYSSHSFSLTQKTQPRLKKYTGASSDALISPIGIPVFDSQVEQHKDHQENHLEVSTMLKAPREGLCNAVPHLEQKPP